MNHYLAELLNKVKLLKKVNTVITKQINGVKIKVPVINGLGYENLHILEFWMCELLQKIISLKQGAFIDVGVNTGQTLIKLRTVSQTIDYIGFEPNPKCIYYSDALIKVNQFKNCRLIPVGLFDKNTLLQLNFYSDGETDPMASLIDNFRPGEKIYNKIFVPVNRFDQVNGLLDLQQIAIIKIDVEGAELEVLQSMETQITRYRPMIIMEILPCYSENNTTRIDRQLQIEALFRAREYSTIRIIKKKDEKNIESLQLLETIGVHGNIDLCEYIFVPREQQESFLNKS